MDVRVELWEMWEKKAECRRIDAFELWCWRRLLRVPWTARRSNQSILREISPGCSLKGMMLKLKLQYFGHLMQRVDSLEKTLMLGGIGDRRRKGRQRMRCWMASLTRWTWVWVNSGSWWWTGRPGVLRFKGSQRVGHDWATDLIWFIVCLFLGKKYLFRSSAHCLVGLLFCCWVVQVLCLLWILTCYQIYMAFKYFSPFINYLFILLIVFFAVQKPFR